MTTLGIWRTPAEIMAQPMSGSAWTKLTSDAAGSIGTPTLADQDSSANVITLAKALVYARTGNTTYRSQVASALDTIANDDTEDGGSSRALSVGRELCAYVIAADLIDLQSHDPALDTQFRAKLTQLLSKILPDGRSLRSCHEDRPNNWGTHCGASRAAVAAYLQNTAELIATAQVFKGWLGDRTAYSGFSFDSDLSWCSTPSTPVSVNPVGAVISGHNVDGAMPEEMRRASSFTWPPGYTGYAWEALQGSLVLAEILARQPTVITQFGSSPWEWESQALKRAVVFLNSLVPFSSSWQPTGDDNWQPWLVNYAYGITVSTPVTSPTSAGKNMGYTDYTHAPTSGGGSNTAPVVSAGADQSITLPATASLTGSAVDDGLPSGTLTHAWSKVSGPGTVTFSASTSLSTTATFSVAGTYVLRLTTSDGALSGTDDITVTANAAGGSNTAPAPNAGSDQVITLPATASLVGTATDDGLPSGTLTHAWSKVSGPGTVTFSASSALNTTASFSAAGTYVLRLTTSDGALSGTNDVTVTVNAAATNTAPTANAGANQTITLPATASLVGTATDDGLPSGTLTHAWSKNSGPGTVTFSASTSLSTTATFSVAGTYVLRLTTSDGALSDTDDVTVTVNAAVTNAAPVVNAGANQTVTLPATASLTGSAADDGLPSGALTHAWSKVSGPGTVTFSASTALSTTAAFSVSGTYVLRLTTSDGSLSGSDDVTITVNPLPNTAPVVNAGADQIITLPATANLTGTATDDGLPNGTLTHAWSKVSGPGTVTFSASTALNTTAAFSVAGTYVLRLTTSDGSLGTSDDVQLTVNATSTNAPPVVSVSSDPTTFTIPAGTTLTGAVSDDGLPSGTLTHLWSKVSGPGTVTFASPTSLITTANVSVAGIYILRLTSSDGSLAGSQDIQVNALGGTVNAAPIVNAGPDQVVTLPTPATLTGSATDDGLPTFTLSYQWSKVSGPGVVTFANAFVASTTALFSAAGTYVLQLLVGDGLLTGIDLVTVTALSAANIPPTVNAGADRTALIGNPAILLLGSASDDSGTALSYAWSKVSGPGTVTFGTATAANTTALFSAIGSYTLRLTATDSYGLSGSDDITVNVSAGINGAPFVYAGDDRDLLLYSGNAVLSPFPSVQDDGLIQSVNTFWSKISGPGTVTFDDPTDLTENIHFNAAGTYVLRLHAFDGVGTSIDDMTVIVRSSVLPPVVDAGEPIAVNGGGTARMNASVTDPNTPPLVSAIEYLWSVSSAPVGANAIFDDSTVRNPLCSFSATGTYILQLRAGNIVAGYGTDTMVVTVAGVAVNNPPVVNAGPDQTISLTGTVTLNGSAVDDGVPFGAELSYAWTKVSGPGTVAFHGVGQTEPNTVASFYTDGTYVLRLTVSDGFVSGYDEVTVIVTPVANTAPVVNAGPDQTVLTATANIGAFATDDNLPAPGILTYAWTKVSGPGTVTFANANFPGTTATFSTPGAYVLRMTVSDGELTSFDDVTITYAINQAPVVDAGPNQTITLPATATMNGTATDDGLPHSALWYFWNHVGGPGAVSFSAYNSLTTAVTFTAPGTHVLRLTASDDLLLTSDDVTITVLAAISNTPPSVNAGNDQVVLLPSVASLSGSVVDDGLPGGALTYAWSKVSGPGTVTFSAPTSLNTTASFSVAGAYVLRLTVSDSALSSFDDLTVTASDGSSNTAPVVNAGADQTVTLPASASLVGNAVDDGLPGGTLTHAWSVVSGPGTVTFSAPTSPSTAASFSVAGTYVLRLASSDGLLTGSDVVQVTVNAAAVNNPPSVNAGGDQALTLPATASLVGTATDDGLPSGTLTHTWSKVSGPGTVTFSTPTGLSTTASFSAAGVYVLRLTSSDGVLSGFDDVQIVMNTAIPNNPPVVNSGANQTIVFPSSATLTGVATDDGQPAGVLSYVWSKVSGPGSVTFSAPTALSTTVSFSMFGAYVLRLTASDGAVSGFDDVAITVQSNTSAGISRRPLQYV